MLTAVVGVKPMTKRATAVKEEAAEI